MDQIKIERFSSPNGFLRGELNAFQRYEVWGYNQHIVCVAIPAGQKVEVILHSTPKAFEKIEKEEAHCTVKRTDKSITYKIDGYYAELEWRVLSSPIDGEGKVGESPRVYVTSYVV